MIEIYTDGCCKRDKRGAWGAVVLNGTATKIIGGFHEGTTNNIMEMMGPKHGLDACGYFPEEIKIYSDSKYFVNAFNTWVEKWHRNGWRTAEKEDVKNKELWQELLRLKRSFKLMPVAEWVKGHHENIWNRIADKTADHCFYQNQGININFKSPSHLKLNYDEHIGKLRA